MKNKLLKAIFMVIILIAVIGIKTTVKANSISSINMDIYVQSNGDAEVTEVWTCSTNQGTECYHPYYNLGNSKITNLRVADKTKSYTTLGTWNTSGSLSSKAYKCGINKVSNGVELCWGISNYGSNIYTVKYNISHFVSELTDSQMMYWTLIPYDFSNTIGNVKIRVHADKPFESTIPVWGYGKRGALCYVSNGSIYMDTDGDSLGKSEYMTFLAQFPKGTFSTTNLLDYDFNNYFKMAEEGSVKYNKSKSKTKIDGDMIEGIFSLIIYILLPFIGIVFGAAKSNTNKFGFKYGKSGKSTKDAPYYRDIPCNGDIFRTYYIAYQYGLMKKKTDILGAIILKWLKQGIIRTEQREGGTIFKKEETVIILRDEFLNGTEILYEVKTHFADKFENDKEKELFIMMYQASKDGILENKEFERWCSKSYSQILKWFDQILEEQRKNLVESGAIKMETGGFWLKEYESTPELKEEAMKIAGLKRFLLEYTFCHSFLVFLVLDLLLLHLLHIQMSLIVLILIYLVFLHILLLHIVLHDIPID